MVVPWAAVFILSIVALLVLPKRYKSSTLIIIESEKVPDSFVAKVATEDRSRRLEAIRPEILSRTRLERVAEDTKPYPGMASTRQAVDLLRRRTLINPSGSDGFTIEFIHDDPRKAQEVNHRLTTLFIEETTKSRKAQVEEAVDFLVTQVGDARKKLEEKEEALRRFKEARMGRLPGQLESNVATMGMLQQELRTIEESLSFARERQSTISRATRAGGGAAAGATEAHGAAAPARVDERALHRRAPGRPEPQGAHRPARGASDGERGERSPVIPRCAELRQPRPAGGRQRGDRAARRRSEKTSSVGLPPSGDVSRTRPGSSRSSITLTRDYEKLSENYSALLAKQLDAEMAGRLERRWKGDRFRVLDPADLPENPYFPRPPLILGLGMLCGLLCGLGAALVAEFLDPTVKDVADLQNLREYNILACIPHLPSLNEAPTR